MTRTCCRGHAYDGEKYPGCPDCLPTRVPDVYRMTLGSWYRADEPLDLSEVALNERIRDFNQRFADWVDRMVLMDLLYPPLAGRISPRWLPWPEVYE